MDDKKKPEEQRTPKPIAEGSPVPSGQSDLAEHANEPQAQADETVFTQDKINRALDHYLQEQEREKQREQRRLEQIERRKRNQKRLRIAGAILILALIIGMIATNPNVRSYYKSHQEAQRPKEEYTIAFNYSAGMRVLPLGSNLLFYDGNNLRLLQKDGTELFDVPFMLGSWDLEASNQSIYLLDRIEKQLYFIDPKGNFTAKIALQNLPHKLYAGKSGHAVLHYRSEAGVEGVVIYNREGKVLADETYPKTTITMVCVSDDNVVSVHGMLRTAQGLENTVYRYADSGALLLSKSYSDVIFVRQYESRGRIAYVDVNTIQFFNKLTNTDEKAVTSLISARRIAYDDQSAQIYILDNRNRLRVVDMDGNIVEERHYQMQYNQLHVFAGELLLIGEDYIRTRDTEMTFGSDIQEVFQLENYLCVLMEGEIRLMNKLS